MFELDKNDLTFLAIIIFCVCMFAGKPDLHDVVIQYIQKITETTTCK